MEYIATFFTHFGAMSFHKKLKKLGHLSQMSPVPRELSSSCGTCVRFSCPFDPESMTIQDMEKVFISDGGVYKEIFSSEK